MSIPGGIAFRSSKTYLTIRGSHKLSCSLEDDGEDEDDENENDDNGGAFVLL